MTSEATSNPQEQGVNNNVANANGSISGGVGDGVKNLLDLSESGELMPEIVTTSSSAQVGGGKSNGDKEQSGNIAVSGTVVEIPPSNTKQEVRIRELEMLLAASQAMVDSLSKDKIQMTKSKESKEDDVHSSILMELQDKLQSEMALKAEAENKLRLAQKQVAELESHGREQSEEFEKYSGLQKALQEAMDAKEEVENNLSSALERIETLEQENSSQQMQLEELHKNVAMSKATIVEQDQELLRLRDQRDEQERKEMSLTNRLNAAKKKEAVKANEAEKYEEELKVVTKEREEAKHQVEELRTTKETLQKELEGTIVSSRQRQVQTEAALSEERKLNEDRKQKMKVFIEKKSEELRQAKADNEALQVELNQTSRSLSDLNIRWKQLHAQWVQSQTRNRELQREFHRIKKDSENLHKVGDTLEMKLSKSATETEEHKNKRLAAKNELMEVLRTLEAEREISARLRDSIKFTFTPKALSQQQLLNESVADFDSQLVKLSMRLRKPLPPTNTDADGSNNEDNNGDDGWIEPLDDEEGNEETNSDSSPFSRSNRETHRLIEKLNRETQQVSKCIMAIVGGIERMHLMLDNSGDRSCYSVLSDILAVTGSVAGPDASGRHDETTAMTGSQMHSITSRHYHS
ncbi:hypothetical protein ACA910_008553 [Epithemia clementina (nom. ined.)]